MWKKVLNLLKKRLIIVWIVAFVAALLAGYFIGRVNSSRDRVISKLEVSLKEGDTGSLRKIVTLNDKKVTKEQLEPLIKYYRENPQSIENLISSLKNGHDTSVFKLTENKNDLFNTYKLEVNSYNIKVNSNFENGVFTIDNKNYISEGESIENIIPGIYTVNGIIKSEYGNVSASSECVLTKDEEVQVKFDAINIDIQSVFKDAKVYVNGEYTGKTVEEIDEIGPFKNDGSNYIYIEKDFPWGTIKGKEEYIKDVPTINLGINISNEILKDDLKVTTDRFYKSVFVALNSGEKSDISNADDSVKNKIYSILEQKYLFLKNEYTVNDIKIIEDKNEYSYDGEKYKINAIVEIDYSVEKRIFSLQKEQKTKKFFTKLVYDEESMEWIVNGVENFSL